jgi:isoquinoline 1-oxidoreductase beta subunit
MSRLRPKVNRRRVLKAAALVVAFSLTGAKAVSAHVLVLGGWDKDAPTVKAIGGFIRIDAAGRIVLVMPSVEMGQGIYTAEAVLLAEELDVGLDQVDLVAAPPDASLYAQPLFKAQMTGGSTSIRGFWTPLRQAGATVRAMLVAAAAAPGGVPAQTSATHPAPGTRLRRRRRQTYR